LAGRLNTPGHAQSIVVADQLVYVADGEGGVLVLRAVVVNESVSLE
jgi:hypothetical protein